MTERKNLEQLFDEIIRLLQSEENQEFAIFYDGQSGWSARAVNECTAVSLGESEGFYEAEGNSVLEAMLRLEDNIRMKKRRP